MLIYDNVTADKYVIMPDHVPLIISIVSDDNGRTKFAPTFYQGDYSFDLHLIHDFENVAYVMAKLADSEVPDTIEEWLDGFDTFSIYQILPEIMELWGLNTKTTIEPQKTSQDRAGNDDPALFTAVPSDRDSS